MARRFPSVAQRTGRIVCGPIVFGLVALVTHGAIAGTGYKCVDAQGRIAYQDAPCPPRTQDTPFHYTDVPDAPLPSAPDEPAPSVAPSAAPFRSEPVAVTPLYACVRADNGKRYTSESGDSAPYAVPLGILGFPGGGIAGTDRRGGGVSAPGLSRTPVDTSASASVAAGYVWVRDECVELSSGAACRERANERDRIQAQLRRAFKDQRPALEQRLNEIDARLGGC